MTRRLAARRDERGFVLPIVLGVLLVVTLVTGALLMYAVQGSQAANEARKDMRASATADAAIDVAVYRLNKTLATSSITGVVNLASDVVSCVQVDALTGALSVGSLAVGGWCPAIPWEATEDTAVGSNKFRYIVSSSVKVTGSIGDVLQRKVVSQDGAGRRVVALIQLDLNPDNILSLFSVKRTAECRPTAPGAALTLTGCPAL
ncbi:hypothetical protein [Conexibacter sp. SYSU D00693]|uniref:hypothetical protein n=1 Tax=Conexibacter sp. SYSU D00693 TaxID=2812560 RepID=UPI00196B727F|nr:hypothetical protein [Conexibacter sp. SYSU D00693]